MGIPGPAIPKHNFYCVLFLGLDDSFAKTAEILLKPFKVPVRYADFVIAKTESAFFEKMLWETTLAVVQVDSAENLEIFGYSQGSDSIFEQKKDFQKPYIVIAYSNFDLLNIDLRFTPDLWLVQLEEPIQELMTERAALEITAEKWIAKGATAVAVFSLDGAACWISNSAAFGQSRGFYTPEFSSQPSQSTSLSTSNSSTPKTPTKEALKTAPLKFFCAGVVQALIEELLGENLFLKTSASIDRECLEARPLHLARAAESGLAAHQVFIETFTEPPGMTLLHHKDRLLDGVRQQLSAWRGPEPKAWGNRGR